MNTPQILPNLTVERAVESAGSSTVAIYSMVIAETARRLASGTLIDVGCGTGSLWSTLQSRFQRYIGVDVVRFEKFPDRLEFVEFNLDTGKVPLNDCCGDCVICIETVEHVENPRALFRELTRLLKPDGLVIVTTPNQLSLVSVLSLLLRRHFDAFVERPGNYPAHITALLETDLVRIAAECGLEDVDIRFSNDGRVPMTCWRWPRWLQGRAFSDNILISARRRSNHAG